MTLSETRANGDESRMSSLGRYWTMAGSYRYRRANVLLTADGMRSHVTITRRHSGLDRYYHFITDFVWPIYTWSALQSRDAQPRLSDAVSLGRQPLRFSGLFEEIFGVPLRADQLRYRTMLAPFSRRAERVSCCNTLRRCYLEGFDDLAAARADLARFNAYLETRFAAPPSERATVTLIEREGGEADRGATRRTVTNHKVVAEAIETFCSRNALAFRNVQLDGLSFAEQFRIFRTSRVIIGQHGAGLTNALWLKPGAASLIELAQRDTRDHFSNLSEDFGVAYARLTCPLADASTPSQERITVDPDAVVAQLQAQLDVEHPGNVATGSD
ncbi:MAG: glycosyltransferase family 61 protein [Pseudomonadota bacterium]